MRFWYVIEHRRSKVEFELQLKRAKNKKYIAWYQRQNERNSFKIYRDILCWLLLFPRSQASYSWYCQRKTEADLQKQIMQRVPVQRATTFTSLRTPSYCELGQQATPKLNKGSRHIAGPSATDDPIPFIVQKCICTIYRVESSIRFSSYWKQYITHTDSVRHNKYLHFWRCLFELKT